MSKIYRVREFAERVGKSASTVRRWDREGRFSSKRTPGGHRYYDELDVRKALSLEPPEEEKRAVVCCRVSSRNQGTDLRLQKEAMQQFCLGAGLAVDEWIEEFGSGMNLRRRAFLDLVERIEEGRIKRLLVAHKDRLVRFGFEFLRGLRNAMGVRLRWSIRNNSPLSGKWWRL